MNANRRDFIRNASFLALASAGNGLSGCLSLGGTGSMTNFACAPMEKIRVGFVGLGERGLAAVPRVTILPGVECAALCDLRPERVDLAVKNVTERKRPGALRRYEGREDSWKGVCDDPNVDVVYVVVPAQLHFEIVLYALKAGKHVLVEVPACQTLDECWEIVETTEKVRRHCMMLENCIYGENEMLAWNLCHQGVLGTLSYAEGGYIHNLTGRHLADNFRNRKRMNNPGTVTHRYGNTYPTHGLGPICTYMDINRGDVMTSIVSMSTLSAAHTEYARAKFAPEAWQNRSPWLTGDANLSLIRTARGRVILMAEDQATPRQYSRLNCIYGTRGSFRDFPLEIVLSSKTPGDHPDYGGCKAEREALLAKYRHPLWKRASALAKKVGGHGGMDFFMDLRWVYCLQNGLPLDMDVYDLAAWSAIVPCSADSDRRGGVPVEIPDFTRGGWRTAKPLVIGDVDLDKMGFDYKLADQVDGQLRV